MLLQILTAKQLAVWRIEHNGEILKMRQQQGKATLLKLLICHFLRANQPHTQTSLCSLEYRFSKIAKVRLSYFLPLISLNFYFILKSLII